MFRSLEELDRALRESGYIADSVTVSTVYLAAALQRPLLLEGVAGAGKTQLAYAVAEAAETAVERLQCYQGIDLKRRQGKERVTYPHESLVPVLERTLGVPLFQEQLLRMVMICASFTGGEAEELRRALATNGPNSACARLRLSCGLA
jgi:hypothetical protein